MKDMVGEEVFEGDFLIDDRGKLFVAQPTEPSFRRESIIITCEYHPRTLGKRGFMREKLALKVSERHLRTPQQDLRTMWKAVYTLKVAPQNREDIKARRTNFQKREKS